MSGLGSPAVLAWLGLITAVAGLARGLTGFGGALVMAPLFGLLLPAPQAAVLIVLLHCVTALQGVRVWAHAVRWRSVLPLAALAVTCAALSAPWVARCNGSDLRHGVAVAVLAVTVLHMRGWRWRHGNGWTPLCVAGVASGVLTAIGGLGGPPAVYYFSGIATARAPGTAQLRANLTGYFAALFGGVTVLLVLNGRAGAPQWYATACLAPAFMLGAWAGGRVSARLPARWFDRAVSVLLLATGLVALMA